MSRIRSIKPTFFTSADIVALSPLARLLYVALWCEADREGRLMWKPRTFKLRCLPGDACDIEELCAELVRARLVALYEAGGERLAVIPTFTRHQIVNNRESASVLPAPPDTLLTGAPRVPDASATRDDAQGTALTGMERKEGKEGSVDAHSPKARRLRSAPNAVSIETLTDAGLDSRTAADFIAHKSAVKAPLTERAWADHCREAEKAGWTPQKAAEKVMARGWKGFEAKYVADEQPGRSTNDVFAGAR